MDVADISSDTIELRTATAVAAVQERAKIKLFPFIGKCYSCEAEIEGRAFCDTACREDYEMNQQRINRRSNVKR